MLKTQMMRGLLLVCISGVLFTSAAAAPDELSAADVVAKNIAARGGLQAWRAVQTLSLSGKLGVGGNQRAALAVPVPNRKAGQKNVEEISTQRPVEEAQLPFVMELKRPRKMRMELQFNGHKAIQVFDGTNGWKLRPFLNRREVEPYTADELKVASTQTELDGPLIDYAAKGNQIELEGTEKVENRNTYKLKLTTKSGETIHLWIDAETFLETKIEGQPRRLDGAYHPVEVYFRDYRPVGGLQIPYLLETRVLPVAKTKLGFKDTPVPPEQIIIEEVAVNPKLEDSLFSKAAVEAAAKVK
jgi:hypothetical protein